MFFNNHSKECLDVFGMPIVLTILMLFSLLLAF